MSSFIQEIDARTQLAGANRFEILLFSMGVSEIYGINVFKVREVFSLPVLTRLPETDARIEGLLSVRGTTLPVIDLRQVLGLPDFPREDGKVVGATDYVGKFDPKELSTMVLKYCTERHTPHPN
jgi:two-component system chemotaxis response regulator CheV